jgi:hypothetical protein
LRFYIVEPLATFSTDGGVSTIDVRAGGRW